MFRGGTSGLRNAVHLSTAVFLLMASGCGAIKRYALDMTGAVLLEGSRAINEEPDFEMVRDSFPGNLKTVEVMMAANPGNLDMLYMAGEGFAAYTYLVIEDDIDLADAAGDAKKVAQLKTRASALYLRAQNYTAQLNRTKDTPSFEVRKILETGTPDQMKELLAKFVKKDVPGLFWYTFSWVGQVNLDQSNPARISDLPRIEALINRIIELDPLYYNGLPMIIAGSVYSRGALFGGDLPRGNTYFERGVKASDGKFLIAKFNWARYYALQAQDKALYCKLLQEVIDAPSTLLPEQQMMNNVSQRWASRWIGRASSLFEEGQGCVTQAPAKIEVEGVNDELL
jgi:hypothetical protein